MTEAFLIVAFVISLIEILGQVVFLSIYGIWYKPASVATIAAEAAGEEVDPDERRNQVHENLARRTIHPYFGTIAVNAEFETPWLHGFYTKSHLSVPPEKFDNNAVNIILTGGSVANLLGLQGRLVEVFNRESKRIGVDVQTNIFVAATGGYKQPQQLLVLSYFLSLGAQPDIVINLDGFNDIVLPVMENLPQGVHPSFPRRWNLQIRLATGDLDFLLLSDALRLRRNLQAISDRLWRGDWFYRSALLGLVVRWRVSALASRRIEVSKTLNQLVSGRRLSVYGPEFKRTRKAVYAMSADIWERASQKMKALAQSTGAEFYHFLQPNQYVESCKPFSDEEIREFVKLENPNGAGAIAREGYPYLLTRGEALRKAGIEFIDATGLFEHEARTVYVDQSCHFNELGNQKLAEFVARTVLMKTQKYEDIGRG